MSDSPVPSPQRRDQKLVSQLIDATFTSQPSEVRACLSFSFLAFLATTSTIGSAFVSCKAAWALVAISSTIWVTSMLMTWRTIAVARSDRREGNRFDRKDGIRINMTFVSKKIPKGTLSKIQDYLVAFRKEVVEHLTAIEDIAPIRLSDVRSNIFLPDYEDNRECSLFHLHIPHEKLRSNMANVDEWELRLKPGEGATGRAFSVKTTQVATRTGNENWDPKFPLRKEAIEKIDNDLRWVISFPIISSKNDEPFGVMNVDCIGVDVADKHLGQLAAKLALIVAKIADDLARIPKMHGEYFVRSSK